MLQPILTPGFDHCDRLYDEEELIKKLSFIMCCIDHSLHKSTTGEKLLFRRALR